MVSNKAAQLKKKRKLVAKQIKWNLLRKKYIDSCAFSLVDNHQKQHMQPTEMLKKNQYLVKMADFKNTPFRPLTQESLNNNFLSMPQCQNYALHQY